MRSRPRLDEEGRNANGEPGDRRDVDRPVGRDEDLEALTALINEGAVAPSADRIAERAGISTRSVYVHFSSLDDLYRAAVERMTAVVISLLWPIDPDLPVAERIESLCAQRARVNEDVGPMRRAAARLEPSSPTLTESRGYARRSSREQVERIFAVELKRFTADERARRIATIDAIISGEAWDVLRSHDGPAPEQAQVATAEAVRDLLRPPA